MIKEELAASNEALRPVAEAALAEARIFFSVGTEWQVELVATRIFQPGVIAICKQMPDYMSATIEYMPERCTSPAHLWRAIGHEVAHLATTELAVFNNAYRAQHGDMTGALASVYTHMTERLVSRLDRLWARERPLPPALEPRP